MHQPLPLHLPLPIFSVITAYSIHYTKLYEKNVLYNIGFTEPWLFDRPISAGFDIYKFDNEYDYYDKDAMGLTLRGASRRFWDYTTIGLNYNIEKFDIDDVDSEHTSVTEGSYLTSSIRNNFV